MMLYEKRGIFKYFFLVAASLIAVASLIVSNSLVRDLAGEERKKMELWAEATREFSKSDGKTDLSITLKILAGNTTIPTILCDDKGNIISSVNIKLPAVGETAFLQKKLQTFKTEHAPITINENGPGGFRQLIYYDDSYTLKRLSWYPYVQLSVLAIFFLVSFLALLSSKKAEQNKVWVGLSKETAHQLGTPISSLMAWVEYFKMKNLEPSLVGEMEKDVARLQVITDRFSKIGSVPELQVCDLGESLRMTLGYLEKRISRKVTLHLDVEEGVGVMLNESLFSWVVENLTKNAVDAMAGRGDIYYTVADRKSVVYLEITDTGKGIPKSKFKTVFKPGFTTKSRGWGLGLSLVKRIVESYHGGRIYVKSSEIGKGTTFRIELKKSL